MEIIHVVLGKANPSRMNGVNKVVFQLATEQALAGRKVSIWGITKSVEHNYGERPFETQLFKAQRNPFAISGQLRKKLLAAKGNAIFHLHGGWIPTFYRITKVLAKHGIPYVFTPHGAYNTIAMQRSKQMKKLYFKLFERKLLSSASIVHCIGQSEVSGLKSIYPYAITQLTPYGFQVPEIAGEKTERMDEFTIGFVGRIDVYTKGLDLLLNAFQQLSTKHKNAKLWIVGDSPERAGLEEEFQKRNLSEHVVFWGSKFGEDKDQLIRKMHVFAHPSRNEGLPTAVLEASAMKVPCLVSEATNVGQFVDQYKCGVTVENDSVLALANGLQLLKEQWDQNKLIQMGENAAKMVKAEFNWKHIVTEFDRLYQLS